jgi:hypothetical protein
VTREYEQIREGLIKLLCVGDIINYIYTFHKSHHTIFRARIVEINDNAVWLKDFGVCSHNTIECNQGELYIWEKVFHSRKFKIKSLIEVIESKDTHHDTRI